jgi:hypothetical protein
MIDQLTARLAEFDETERKAFVAGASVTFGEVFAAIDAALNTCPDIDLSGVGNVFTRVRAQFEEFGALVAVEGVLG